MSEGRAWAGAARRLGRFLDPAIAVVTATLAVLSALSTDVESIDPRLQPTDLFAALLTGATALTLWWRRTHPTASYVALTAGCLVISASGHYIGLLSLVILFALYSFAAHGRRRDALVALPVTIAVFVGLAAAGVPDLGTSDVLQAGALLVTAWAVGDALRWRRAHQRDRLLAAEQEAAVAREQAGRAATDERLRIARELHDVVAHSMSLIAVQAGVGAHVIRTDPDSAERALEVIADVSRTALTQTRSLLGLLRRDDDAGSALAPAMSVDDVPALVEDVRRAGLPVTLSLTGAARPLDAGTGLAAYRVVQESLTNVIKHAGATSAEVRVDFGEGAVTVEVLDRGGRASAPAAVGLPGHGLVGLRERVQLAGGSIEYGEVAGIGWRVRACLPVAMQPSEPA